MVLKSQVLSGGRMKAGAVKFADTPDEAAAHFDAILPIVVNGQKSCGVLVEEKSPVEQEYYVGITWDGRRKLPVIIFSDMGGIDIEEVAEKHPEHVSKTHVSTLLPFTPHVAKEAIAATGVTGTDLNRLTPIVAELVEIFLRYDLTLAEINPLAKLDGRPLPRARRSRGSRGRGPRQARQAPGGARDQARGDAPGAPADGLRDSRRPGRPSDHRGVAGNVVEFDGNLGLVIGAGGGSLTLFDAVRKHGGKPANYCEIGGNPSVRKACELTKLVLSKPGVEKIAVMMNVVSNTRVDIVARGVDQGLRRVGPRPGGDDRHLPHPRLVGGGRLQDPRASTASSTATASVSMYEAAGRAVAKMEERRGHRACPSSSTRTRPSSSRASPAARR